MRGKSDFQILLMYLGIIITPIIVGCSLESSISKSTPTIGETLFVSDDLGDDAISEESFDTMPDCWVYHYYDQELKPNPSGSAILVSFHSQYWVLNSDDYHLEHLEAFAQMGYRDLVWANDTQFIKQILPREVNENFNHTYQMIQVDQAANPVWQQPYTYVSFASLAGGTLTVSPYTSMIAFPDHKGASIYDPNNDSVVVNLEYEREAIEIKGFSPDGQNVAIILFAEVGSEDYNNGKNRSLIYIIAIDEPENIIVFDEASCYLQASWSPTGQFFATRGDDRLHVYDVETWTKVYTSSSIDIVSSFS